MKKGFTLIELLAVIVILAIIALIATPIILGIINDAREKANERSVELYASSVKNAIAAYQLRTGNEIEAKTYTKETLPFTVEYDGNVECTNIIISEDSKVSLDGCKVNGGEKTYSYGIKEETSSLAGTIGICDPITVAEEGKYTAGDKYECIVDPNKDPYTFYVLNTDGTSVNLIMDSNINISGDAVKDGVSDRGLVAWLDVERYKKAGGQDLTGDEGNCDYGLICTLNIYGPLTAIEYLQTATQDWTNAKKLKVNKFTACSSVENCVDKPMSEYIVNARMPYLNEVSNVSSTTLYLIDYLKNDVQGYWTLSSSNFNTGYAKYVSYEADIDQTPNENKGWIGVRPVITLDI